MTKSLNLCYTNKYNSMPNKGNISWNTGLKGKAAGWTDQRRKQMSLKQKQWCRDNPRNRIYRWITGPDPEVHRHYYRFLRSRAQAKFWRQEWTIIWEDYLDLLKSSSGIWGRKIDNIHLARRDRNKGWHIDNVQVMNRGECMKRKRARDKNGKLIVRKKRKI